MFKIVLSQYSEACSRDWRTLLRSTRNAEIWVCLLNFEDLAFWFWQPCKKFTTLWFGYENCASKHKMVVRKKIFRKLRYFRKYTVIDIIVNEFWIVFFYPRDLFPEKGIILRGTKNHKIFRKIFMLLISEFFNNENFSVSFFWRKVISDNLCSNVTADCSFLEECCIVLELDRKNANEKCAAWYPWRTFFRISLSSYSDFSTRFGWSHFLNCLMRSNIFITSAGWTLTFSVSELFANIFAEEVLWA